MRSSALIPFLALASITGSLAAQQTVEEFEASLRYQYGTVELGRGLATLDLPPDFRFLGPEEGRRLLVDGWGNPPMDPPLGVIVPTSLSPMADEGWAVIVTFEEDGYVEDDEAAELDFTALLREMQEDVRAESEAREEAGYGTMALIGWAEPPHYDSASHKLYWAKELEFGGSADHTLNYNIRALGRRGVLVLNAVASMSMLPAVQADMQSVLGFVDFNEGHRYADFVPGVDKVAAYGIGALIAGKVAAKVGLFKVLLAALVAAKKFVVVALVAVAAFFKRLFGRGEPAAESS